MNPDLILITECATFGDLERGKISPEDIYKEQMDKWLFIPAKHLSELHNVNKEIIFSHGYSLLGLLLIFFESHGKYLNGTTERNSRSQFMTAFKAFYSFLLEKKLVSEEVIEKEVSESFYGVVRCGVFHSFTLDSDFLVDSRKLNQYVFLKDPKGEKTLICPWMLLLALQEYFDQYLNELNNSETSLLKQNFEKTFTKLFTL